MTVERTVRSTVSIPGKTIPGRSDLTLLVNNAIQEAAVVVRTYMRKEITGTVVRSYSAVERDQVDHGKRAFVY
jgi:hypothetical protein